MGKKFPQRFQENQNNFRNQLTSYAIEENPYFKNFPEFKENALVQRFGWIESENYLTEDVAITLFQQDNVRTQLEKNIGKKKSDEIYETLDEGVVEIIPPKKEVIFRPEVIQVKTTKRRPHTRTKAQTWNPIQTRFLQVRKKRGLKPKQIIKEFHEEFTPRTESSIKNKLYRV